MGNAREKTYADRINLRLDAKTGEALAKLSSSMRYSSSAVIRRLINLASGEWGVDQVTITATVLPAVKEKLEKNGEAIAVVFERFLREWASTIPDPSVLIPVPGHSSQCCSGPFAGDVDGTGVCLACGGECYSMPCDPE